MDDGSRCMKYLIFLVNLIFVLAGLALIALGAALFFDLSRLDPDLNNLRDLLPFGPWVILIFGIVVFFISFLGCCGAIKESKCMLICFATILLVLFVVKVSFGTVLLVKPESVESQASNSIDELYRKGIRNDTNAFEMALKCCGPNGPKYYSSMQPAPPCYSHWTNGCQERAKELIKKYRKMIAAVFIGIAIVEGLGVLLVLMLVCSISSSHEARLLY